MSARRPALLFAIASCAAGQSSTPSTPAATTHAPVGSDAVWAPLAGFLATLHEACDGHAAAFGDCFVEQMQKAGAPAPAVAFARRTDNQGYLREYRDTDRVGVACAEYPFRANENTVCFLVNGAPAMIDVDDPVQIDKAALSHNAVYAGLLEAYPNLAIFPGPRSGELAVAAVPVSNGGQRFVADYLLVDGCRACARVGSLLMAFDFEANGNFVGARGVAVRALRP